MMVGGSLTEPATDHHGVSVDTERERAEAYERERKEANERHERERLEERERDDRERKVERERYESDQREP
jgi:hypothetical protein